MMTIFFHNVETECKLGGIYSTGEDHKFKTLSLTGSLEIVTLCWSYEIFSWLWLSAETETNFEFRKRQKNSKKYNIARGNKL